MKVKIIILLFIISLGGNSFANTCSEQNINSSNEKDLGSDGPEIYYNNFFKNQIVHKKESIHYILSCFQDENTNENCHYALEAYREFARNEYENMMVSLMIYKESSEVHHDSNPSLELEPSQDSITEYKKALSKVEESSVENTAFNSRSEIYRKQRDRVNKFKENHKQKYLNLITFWPFLKYIKSTNGLNQQKIDLVIIDALSRQYKAMELSASKIEDNQSDEYLYSETALKYFKKKNKVYTPELCDFLEEVEQYISNSNRKEFATTVVAPIAITIGGCLLSTPVGCIVIGLSTSSIATVADIYLTNESLKLEIDKSNLSISSENDVALERQNRNLSIYMSPTVVLETFLGVRALRLINRGIK